MTTSPYDEVRRSVFEALSLQTAEEGGQPLASPGVDASVTGGLVGVVVAVAGVAAVWQCWRAHRGEEDQR